MLVVNEGPDGDLHHNIVAPLTGAVITGAVAAAVGFYKVAVGVGFERLEVVGGAKDDRAAVAPVAAVRAAAGHVLFAVKRDATVAPAPGADYKTGFIYKLQRG